MAENTPTRSACTVEIKNTVIGMTSNLGSRFPFDGVSGTLIPESVRESAAPRFSPGFLNRIGETILFEPLSIGRSRRSWNS